MRASTGDRSSPPAAALWLPLPLASSRQNKSTKVPPASLIVSSPAFPFRSSVDVGTLDLGIAVATAALAAGIDIVEMGTPLLSTQGVADVVPAFRKRFPDALLLADMKTMDGGGGEARGVYSGGGNIVDFLALAGVDTAQSN